jgi:hypothetical protein
MIKSFNACRVALFEVKEERAIAPNQGMGGWAISLIDR